jgi:hypothetical protein
MKIKDFIFRLFGYQKRVLLGLDGTAKEKYIKRMWEILEESK